MKLIIAEKPSVGMDFAKALGIKEKKDGYIVSNNNYLITWAIGHLVEIDDSIAPQTWDLKTLPIIPQSFRYRANPKTSKQLKVIKDLIKQAKEVIISTDAGREGELIARLILNTAGWKNWDKTYRFWTSEALTKEVILRELKNLKPAKDYDSLYFSALARQHSDWIVGINLTRAVSVKAKEGVWSVGRVQTPLLRLIVERDIEIENFKPEEYYVVKGIFKAGSFEYEGFLKLSGYVKTENNKQEEDEEEEKEKEIGNRLNKETAEKIVKECKEYKEAVVFAVKRETVKEEPPLLCSLTSLQREANQIYGFSAEKTLILAQDLYEAKLISYPRTDAQHLSESSRELVKSILKRLGKEDLAERVDSIGKRVFDDSKLTDHYAIIPMDSFKELGEEHKKIYNLIYRKFIGAFMDNYIYETLSVITVIKDYQFYSNFKADKSLGWKSLYTSDIKNNLIEIDKGQKVNVKDVKEEKKFTKPPSRYTEGKLLKKMEALGLGTPATRSSIIETLKKRGYITSQKKNLISTQKGRELIEKLKDRKIADVKLTSEWERELDAIYKQRKGYKGYKEFLERIEGFTKEEIEQIKAKEFESKKEEIGKCLCGGSIVAYPKLYKCEACGKTIWKEFLGKNISKDIAVSLMQGKTVLMKGLKSKAGNKFDAYAVMEDNKVSLKFSDTKAGGKKR